MKIAISAESTIDLTKEILEKYNIHTINFHLSLAGKDYNDGDLTNEEIYKLVESNNELPQTSAVNLAEYYYYFKKLKEEYDAIIHLSLSKELSSAYSNAVTASKDFDNVYVIDSRTLSTGIGLLAIKASKLVESGNEVSDIVKKIKEMRNGVEASFILHNLNYLHKGGRCSLISLLTSKVLKIHPQIIVNNGIMTPSKKFIGNYYDCVRKYARSILERFDNPDKSVGFVTYSSRDERMIEICREEMIKAGFETIYETSSGSTITSHCGEMCIGILYINN